MHFEGAKPLRLRARIATLMMARVVAGIAQAAAFILLARVSSVAAFGATNALIGLGTFLVSVADFGVSTFLLRVRAVSRHSPLIQTILSINRTGMSLLAIVLFGAYLLIFTRYVNLPSALAVVLWIALERNGETWSGLAVADGRVWLSAILITVRRIVPLALMTVLIMGHTEGVLAFSIGQATGGVLGVAIVRAAVKAPPKSAARVSYWRVLKAAFPYWLTVASSQAREAETFAVALAGGATSAAGYNVAQRLTRPLQIISMSMAQVVLPSAATADRHERALLLRQNGLATAFLTLGCGAILPLLPYLVPTVLGPGYAGAVTATQIAVLGAAVSTMSSPLASLLQGIGMQHRTMIISMFTAIASLASAFCFTAALGSTAALAAVYVLLSCKYIALYVSAYRRLVPSASLDGHRKG